MLDSITILTVTATLLGEMGKGILGNRTDHFFCESIKDIYGRLGNNIKQPANHDILKAVRRAQINSTLMACQHIAKTKYKFWDGLFSKAPINLREVSLYLKKELDSLEKKEFKFAENELNDNTDFLLNPNGSLLENRLEELKSNQKKLIIDELKNSNLNWVEKDLEIAIFNGWKEKGIIIDWYDLMSAFFAEEIKTNSRLSTIIKTEYILDIKYDVDNVQKSFSKFNETVQKLFLHYQIILPEIKDIYRVIELQKQEIIEEIKSDGNKTRDLIEEFRKELRRELKEQSNNIQNPHAKYVGTLIDFFGEVPLDGKLDIEVAVKSDMNIYLFHSYPLKVALQRVEFFVDESRLVFLSKDYARRDIGLPISQKVASYLIKDNDITLVHLELPSKEVKRMTNLPLKIYQ